jgi:hypothetical protein
MIERYPLGTMVHVARSCDPDAPIVVGTIRGYVQDDALLRTDNGPMFVPIAATVKPCLRAASATDTSPRSTSSTRATRRLAVQRLRLSSCSLAMYNLRTHCSVS